MIGRGITRLGGVGIAVVVTMLLVNERLVRRASSGTQQEPARREVTIEASGCAFTPDFVEATQGERMRITLIARDRPHVFVIDEYRIARRFSPDRPGIVELLLDRPGRFAFYSNLTTETCVAMRGQLVVHPR